MGRPTSFDSESDETTGVARIIWPTRVRASSIASRPITGGRQAWSVGGGAAARCRRQSGIELTIEPDGFPLLGLHPPVEDDGGPEDPEEFAGGPHDAAA